MKNQRFNHRLGFALAGLKAAWQAERSFRTQSFYAVFAIVLLLALQPAPIWWALILLLVLMVMATELINTALEHLADHLHPEAHPKIKLVKDCAAGAVLLLSIASGIVTVAMLIDYFSVS